MIGWFSCASAFINQIIHLQFVLSSHFVLLGILNPLFLVKIETVALETVCSDQQSLVWLKALERFFLKEKKIEVQQMGLVLSAVAFRNCFVREIQSLRRVGAAIACPGAYDYRDYPHFFSCFVFSVRDFFFVERVWVLDRPRNRERERERERDELSQVITGVGAAVNS